MVPYHTQGIPSCSFLDNAFNIYRNKTGVLKGFNMLCQVMFLSKAKSLHSVHCTFELFFWHFTLMNRFNMHFQIMFLSKGNIITKLILEFLLLYFAVMNCSNVSVYNLFRGISFGTVKWDVNVLLKFFEG